MIMSGSCSGHLISPKLAVKAQKSPCLLVYYSLVKDCKQRNLISLFNKKKQRTIIFLLILFVFLLEKANQTVFSNILKYRKPIKKPCEHHMIEVLELPQCLNTKIGYCPFFIPKLWPSLYDQLWRTLWRTGIEIRPSQGSVLMGLNVNACCCLLRKGNWKCVSSCKQCRMEEMLPGKMWYSEAQ